jgi:hypothetical protein
MNIPGDSMSGVGFSPFLKQHFVSVSSGGDECCVLISQKSDGHESYS